MLVVDAATRARLVEPFYLKMMRTNALEYGQELLPVLAEVGRGAAASEVVMLLTGSLLMPGPRGADRIADTAWSEFVGTIAPPCLNGTFRSAGGRGHRLLPWIRRQSVVNR